MYICIKMLYIVKWDRSSITRICFYAIIYSFISSSSEIISNFVSGVTDSKAVTGSKSTLDITPSTNSLVVIVTGVSTGIVFTILVVCLFVTCRRKVRFVFLKHFIPYNVIYFAFLWIDLSAIDSYPIYLSFYFSLTLLSTFYF